MRVYLPSNLNIDNHLERFPPRLVSNFEKDRLNYILSLLLSIPANNKEIAKAEGGWVPISSSILANKVKNYRQYLDYALGLHSPGDKEAILIETDKWYIVDEKCIAYRFKPNLITSSDLIEVEITDKNLNKAEQKESLERKREAAATYPNLVKFFNKGLEIDTKGARAYAELLRKKYHLQKNEHILSLFNEVSVNGSRDWEFSNPDHQYLSYLYNINRIEEGNIFLSVDHNVRRFHSNITNLKKELRDFITYEGHQLVNIDLKNSQPFLSLALFNPNFYKMFPGIDEVSAATDPFALKRSTRKFHISRVAPEIYEILKATNLPKAYQNKKKSGAGNLVDILIMFSKLVQKSDYQDFNKFKLCVSDGLFYEALAQLIKEKLGGELLTRDEAKIIVFQVLFTDNSYFAQEDAGPKRVFAETFPTVYEMFKLIKTTEKNALARLLQSVESWLILDKVCSKLAKMNPQLPVFTIHDSIVTVKGYEGLVKGVMEREIERAVGLKPTLDISYFDSESKLKELSSS